jgi:two-component system, repressor protein LuxO
MKRVMNHTANRRRVLLVEDTASLVRTYQEYLKGEPIELLVADTGAKAMAVLADQVPDAVLLDLMLPDVSGIDVLKYIHINKLPSEVIVITAHGSVNTAVEAMRLGAFDFIIKPFTAERLRVTLNNALERGHLNRIVETYRDIDRQEYFGFVGSSLPMQAIYQIIDSAAESKATVFIAGESGTGKEVCAEAIHKRSNRAGGPFVAINCGAIPKDLMESEIFGHVKGAFTGAVSDHDGAAFRASGGTLFLDEVCEMDMELQTKLLRFVQSGSFQRVGGEKTEQADIRFICATNRDPLQQVADGRFREDLFYRLHVIPLAMPRLAERGGDVMAIAEKLLTDYAAEEGKIFEGFADDIRSAFMDYSWPGNVRQLQNVIRSVVVLNDGGAVTMEMLPAPLDEVPDAPVPQPSGINAIRPLAEVEREIIEHAIRLSGNKVPKAAHALGVSPSTLYRKKAIWEQVAS